MRSTGAVDSVLTGVASYELVAPDEAEMERRMSAITRRPTASASASAAAVVPLADGELHLRAAAHGWSGELVQNGRARAVTVARPG